MKKLYTLILMAMAAITATAADWTYMPMVREGVEWHYATQNVRQGGTDTGNIYLRFDGSETVDGKTYSGKTFIDTTSISSEIASALCSPETAAATLVHMPTLVWPSR